MNNIVFDFRLNYTRGDRMPAMEIVYQYDTSRVIEAYVPEEEDTFFLHVGYEDETTLSIIEVDDVEEDTEDGGYKITATIPDSILTRCGNLMVYVIAADDEEIVTTYEGLVDVRMKAAAEDYVVPDEEAQSIIERAAVAAGRAETAQGAAETAATSAAASASAAESAASSITGGNNIADQYSSSSTYAVGDYCMKDGNLYECNTAISTAEEWTTAHWTAVKITGEISDLKGDLADISPTPITMTSGYYIKLSDSTADINSPVTAAAYSYAVVDCSAGDVFTINGTGGGAPRVYGFLDSSGNVIERAAGSITVSDLLLSAPDNAAKLVINDNSGSTSYKGATPYLLRTYVGTLATYANPKLLTSAVNLNNILSPGVYHVVSGSFPTNYPQSSAETQKLIGFVKVDRYNVTGVADYVSQLVVDYKNHVYVRRRNSSGTWNSWTELASHDEVEAAKAALTTAYTAAVKTVHALSAKIFRRVGCIGDSYTKGYINQGGVAADYPDFSWPAYMSRMTGQTWTNFGVSGSSAREWVERGSYSKLADVEAQGNKCQAYVIGLMINDSNSSSHGYTALGTSADIGTDANSYYAYLYKLINAVHAVNTDAPIFVCTCPRTDETRFATYSVAVRDVVDYCKDTDHNPVYCLDLASNTYNNAQFYQNPEFTADFINGHFTGIGYEYMAECMVHVMSDVINANVSDFQSVHRIAYDAPSA